MRNNYHIVVRLIYLSLYYFPLFIICSTKHFHTNWYVSHFQNRFNNLSSFIF